MNLYEAIKARRSVRRFKDNEIEEDTLMRILDSARYAPTGGNLQPWEFILVRDKEQKQRLVDYTYTGYEAQPGNEQKWILEAPVVIVVCVDFKRTCARYGEPGKKIAIMDTSAAIQNMLLAAVEEGVESCWVSGFDVQKIAEVVALPKSIEPLALLPIGHSAQSSSRPPNKLPLEDIVYKEKYGQSYITD